MTILANIGESIILTTLNNKRKKINENNVGIIDIDYSLIRYVGQAVALSEVTLNNCGYTIIKRDNERYTTLHRFILEYYAKYNEELKQKLDNKKFEINHINKDKLDNRLRNLEIVTHSDNIKHSKGEKYEVVMSSQQLQEIQQKSIENKQQAIDEAYLSRISGLFYKSMKSGIINKKLLKCCYFSYIYYKKGISVISPSSALSSCSLLELISQSLTENHTNNIIKLLQQYKQFIYKAIVDKNIQLLKRYINKYPYIKEVFKKYKIIDEDNYKNSILFELYKKVYESNKYVVSNGDILLTISIKSNFNVVGKYKAFIVLYYLGILERKGDNKKSSFNDYYNRIYPPTLTPDERYQHKPSRIKITALRDNSFKEINTKSKQLLDLKWNSMRYFTVAEQLGQATADNLYANNKRCKSNYKYNIRAKDDIISILKKHQADFKSPFITKHNIIQGVKEINKNRQQNGKNYNKINDSFSRFVSTQLLYNEEIKAIMEKQGYQYTTLNKQIIKNIVEYQKINGIDSTNNYLKPNMKVIVLKILIP